VNVHLTLRILHYAHFTQHLVEMFNCIGRSTRWHLCRAVFVGGVGGVEPPVKISDPPAAIKNNARGVDFLCTYALARSSTSIAKTSTPPNEI